MGFYKDLIDTEDDTQMMAGINRCIFKRGVSLSEANECSEAERIDTIITSHYGITINILPFKRINNKVWRTYNHDQQRKILMRMEASIRRNNPSIQLVELHFEVCPSMQNIHFHALYKMPFIFLSTMRNEWDRLIGPKNKDLKDQAKHYGNSSWKHFHSTFVLESESGHWLEYIRKDQNKA